MSYLKFTIRSRRTDENGSLAKATIKNLETDREADTSDLPVILNALVDVDFKEEEAKEFTLDYSELDGEDYLA